MIDTILSKMDDGDETNNYNTNPLVNDEVEFASKIFEKHLDKNNIFLLTTVKLSVFHTTKQKVKDENKKLQIIIKNSSSRP